ncbi:MAG TPA: hypothetical protein PKE16_09470 [Hyphomicrobium sp.]|nr:hypothetical protein [Hyphomicrobium sp.]
MQPKVVAWALLFVVTFAVVYRLFAWMGRRFRTNRTPEVAAVKPKIERVVPIGRASAAPEADLRPTPAPSPPPARNKAEEPPAVFAAKVPMPAPARTYATDIPVSEALATASEPAILPEAVVAPEISSAPLIGLPTRASVDEARTALAPSVAATIPPRVPLKPSLAATLPPAAPEPLAPMAEARAEPSAQAIAPPPVTATEDVAAAEPSEPIAPETPPEPADEVSAPKFSRLRAHRIGAEAVSLDIRLRDSRERRIRHEPKTARQTAMIVAIKTLRVLVPKTPTEKGPARRIAPKNGDAVVLTSAKAQTKIVGVPQRPSRVLFSPGL